MDAVDAVNGVPCWASLTTRDGQASEDFYGNVLGWFFEDSELGPEYRMAVRDGAPVAGLNETAVPRQMPVRWTVFFAVADADQVSDRIVERGATVAVGPLRLGEGRAVVAADPYGAPFGLWQGERPQGWAIGAGQAPAWLQLHTLDVFDSALFYGAVLDWSKEPGCEVGYEVLEDEVHVRAHGETVATLSGGARPAAPDPRSRPHWDIFFRSPDIDAATDAAARAGGRTVDPPHPTPHGRAATLRDPDGALFSLLET
ncbi:VOC family protein [Streptomyces albiaxialis]|uniref:VOC family protein n=1 Tax=Streptomyces albiaxialis TaxID=329523 RepID=A0ABN2WRR4_9ACTN